MPKHVRDEAGARVWRNRRLFSWKTYDANLFEDFTAGKREELAPLVRDLHWGPGSPAFAAYDTFDSVLTVGTVTEAGRCYRCGGTRRAPACKCGDHAARASGGSSSAGPRSRGAHEETRELVGVGLTPGDDCEGHAREAGTA